MSKCHIVGNHMPRLNYNISVTGNSDTLKHTPAAKGIDVYGRLQDFFNRNYSAQYMTLAVHSKRKYKSFKVCLCAHSKNRISLWF